MLKDTQDKIRLNTNLCLSITCTLLWQGYKIEVLKCKKNANCIKFCPFYVILSSFFEAFVEPESSARSPNVPKGGKERSTYKRH